MVTYVIAVTKKVLFIQFIFLLAEASKQDYSGSFRACSLSGHSCSKVAIVF